MLDPASAEGRAAVAAVLARETGEAGEVAEAVALSGGASSATWRLRLACGRQLIFQRTASDAHAGLPRSAQGALMRRAGALGVPVAPVLAAPLPEDGLGDAIITGFVDGEALAPRWLRDPAFAEARAVLLGQCARALARLHAAPLDHWADLSLAGGSGAELLQTMFALYRRLGVDVPAFDLAFAWLVPRMPAEPASCLSHGDFRSGNLLVAPSGLAAVLDWELAHLSVPEEDLGWLCVQAWRFGNWRQPVGGFGQREDFLAAYAAAGGRPVSREALHLWEVFGTLRWGMSCLQLADDHVSGRLPSVERAAIGRRTTEVAADLVHLLIHGEV
jgi:aminoglycoside phosphotransferase (APT) family kinase protein